MTVSKCIGLFFVAMGASSCDREITIDLLEPEALRADPRPPSGVDASDSPPAETDTTKRPISPTKKDGGRGPADSGADRGETSAGIDAGLDASAPSIESDASPPMDADVAVEPVLPIHHYDFGGEGTVVYDRIGSAHGELMGGAVLDGSGSVLLDGVDDYVQLPAGLISALPAATFIAWVEWNGDACWERLFDFGSFVEREEGGTVGETSVFLTPSACPWSNDDPVISGEFHIDGSLYFAQGQEMASGVLTMAGVVVDTLRGIEVVVDGEIVARSPAPLHLSDIDDVNVWLGKSQWSADVMLSGRYDEFLIFDVALTEAQLAALFVDSAPVVEPLPR